MSDAISGALPIISTRPAGSAWYPLAGLRPCCREAPGSLDSRAMTEHDDALSLDMVTAALRADSTDVAIYARVLTQSLGEALPSEFVTVDRDRTMSDRMRGRPGEITRIAVQLGDQQMTLSVRNGKTVAEICRAVRGVVLSRQTVPVNECGRRHRGRRERPGHLRRAERPGRPGAAPPGRRAAEARVVSGTAYQLLQVQRHIDQEAAGSAGCGAAAGHGAAERAAAGQLPRVCAAVGSDAGGQRPVKVAWPGPLSRKLRMPSRWSAVPNRAANWTRSISRPVARSTPRPWSMACLAARSASAGPVA